MIKQIKNLMLIAVAAMGFASCQDVAVEEITRPQEVVMTITAEADDTRTVIDETSKVVNWSAGDQLKVIENSATYRTTTAINIDGDGKAKFTVSFPANTSATSFTYNAIFPATAVTEDSSEKIDNAKVKVTVKDQQMATAESFDPTADVLVSKHIEAEAQPTELNMQFKRLVALGKMTLNNLPSDAKIERVIFTATEGKGLAGRNYVDATTGEVAQYCYYGKTNTLTINYDEAISTRDIYFTCNPFEMAASETFTVKAVCGNKSYTREVEIPTGRSLKFIEGDLSTFSVDMADATVETNTAFAEGQYVVIAKSGSNYYAMKGVKGSGNYMTYAQVGYDGAANNFTTDDETLVWTIAATDGGYTLQNNEDKYLSGSSSGNYAYLGDAQTLTITPVDGTTQQYYIAVKSLPERILGFNTNSGQERFAFYKGTQANKLYLVPVGDNTEPYFTIEQDLAGYTADGDEIEFEVIAHNGFDAEVTATTDVEWISFDHNGDIIYATAEPNEGAAREAVITFSAEGYKSVEVTVKQDAGENAGANIITIADILKLENGATIDGTIEGTVISNYELGNLTSKKGLYVQDTTGGLQLYLAGNHEFAFGTKVKIDLTGATLGAYNGAVQISGLALDKITVVSTGNTVTPKTVSMADFLANKYEGQYIALEGVQVASADLSKTWVMGDAHTSINMEDANGNKFVVFSSKYATYGTSTVAQGSGTIKGISSINNSTLQIIFAQSSDYAGLTGERFGGSVAPDPEPSGAVKVTVAEFLAAAEDSTVYELTGVIDRMYKNSDSDTLWGNFYLKDNTGEVLIYGLCSPSGEAKYWAESGANVGDTITVQTIRASYNGAAQGKNAIFVSLTPAEGDNEDDNEGDGGNVGGGDTTETTATLTFDSTSKRTQFSSNVQVWSENDITVTNNKAASTNAVADYSKPARFYAGSNLIVGAPGNIKSIVFDCNSSSYATTLKNSIDTSANVTVSSDKVTVTLDGSSNSFTIAKLTAQVRMDSVTVTY